MTEISKPVSFLIIVGMLVIGLAGLAGAQGVPSSRLGYGIFDNTSIDCEGTVKDKVSYKWTYGTGDFDAKNMTLSEGSAAQIRYSGDLKAIDGKVNLERTFKADTGDVPNLEVSKDVGYVAGDGLISMINDTEKVGMSVVDRGEEGENGSVFDMSMICPWNNRGQDEGLVTCGFATAGSSVRAKELSSSTYTRVQTIKAPSLKYNIAAKGKGKISAAICSHYIQGRFNGTSYNIISEVIFRGYSGVSGNFTFTKSMWFTLEGRL